MRDLSQSAVLGAARRLIPSVYAVTLPDSERFGLSSQMRRSVVSIVANIAEGLGRGTEGDFERFLRIASGSAAELETLLGVCGDLGYAQRDALEPLIAEVKIVRAQVYRLALRVHRSR